MLLSDLKLLEAHLILFRAAQLIGELGLAKQMNEDPDTGAIDVEGALMLACGVAELGVLVPRASKVLPPARMAVYEALLDHLDTITPGRIVSEWTDQTETTQGEVVELLSLTAYSIAGSVALRECTSP